MVAAWIDTSLVLVPRINLPERGWRDGLFLWGDSLPSTLLPPPLPRHEGWSNRSRLLHLHTRSTRVPHVMHASECVGQHVHVCFPLPLSLCPPDNSKHTHTEERERWEAEIGGGERGAKHTGRVCSDYKWNLKKASCLWEADKPSRGAEPDDKDWEVVKSQRGKGRRREGREGGTYFPKIHPGEWISGRRSLIDCLTQSCPRRSLYSGLRLVV